MCMHPLLAYWRIGLIGICVAIFWGCANTVVYADNDWSPGPANDPKTCHELWERIGLPRYRPTAEVNTTLVCHSRYVLSHNDSNKTPDWVIERVTRDQISGTNTRPKIKFKSEENVAPSARASDKDYAGGDFDGWHQAPSEDFNANAEWMEESFILSNAVPQVGLGFNRHIWAQLEQNVRDLFEKDESRTELYVITGPVYQDAGGRTLTITAEANTCGNAIKLPPLKKTSICDANNQSRGTACGEAGVAVPAALYKIVFDPELRRSNAFLMPNMDHRDARGSTKAVAYLNKFRTTVYIVQEYTGLPFFTGLEARERRRQVEQ